MVNIFKHLSLPTGYYIGVSLGIFLARREQCIIADARKVSPKWGRSVHRPFPLLKTIL